MCKLSKADMMEAKRLPQYLAGTINSQVRYKKGSFKMTVFCNKDWENNPENDESTSSSLAFISKDSVNSNMGFQGLTVQPTAEANLVAIVARAMKGGNVL